MEPVVRSVRRVLGRTSARATRQVERGVRLLPWYVTCTSLCANVAGIVALWRAWSRPRSFADRSREIASGLADRMGHVLRGAVEDAGVRARELGSRMRGRDYAMLAAGAGAILFLRRLIKRR